MIWARLQKHQSLRQTIPGQPHQRAATATDGDGVLRPGILFHVIVSRSVGNLGLI